MKIETKISKGETTRAHVLMVAMDLINTRGYHNTSIQEIIDASGVKKGNLYFHFSSKEELVLELIKEAKTQYLTYLLDNVKSENPLEKINNILTAVLKLHRKRKFIGGCIFGNLALEMSDVNPEFTAIIRSVFNEWAEMITGYLTEARDSGLLDDRYKPEILGRYIVSSMEGSVMMSKLTKKEDDLINCIQTLRTMIGL